MYTVKTKARQVLIKCSALLAAALLLTACQPTPESPIVAGKNDAEGLLEQAQSNKETNPPDAVQPTAAPEDAPAPGDSLAIPEDGRYVWEMTGAEGKLTIRIDAQVVTPQNRNMPVYKAAIGNFTQAQVTDIFNYFYPDEKPKNEMGYIDTKAEIEAKIIELKKKVAEGKFDGTAEQADAMIAMMEQGWADAPETAPEGGVSDGTLTRWGDDWSDTTRRLYVADEHSQLNIDTDIAVGEVTDTAFLTYEVLDRERSYSMRNPILTDGTDIAPEMLERLGFTYDEADAMCREFLAAAGYEKDAFAVLTAAIIDDTGADYTPGTRYAYYFLYTRTVEGIPLFADRTQKTSANNSGDGAYAINWPYEKIMMEVDKDGIVYIKWNTPIRIGQSIEEDAGLKPFGEIADIMGNAMKVSYEGIVKTVFEGEVDFELEVERMELCLMRIRERGGSPTEGLIVPAWVCFGQCKGTQAGETRYFGNVSKIGATDPADLAFLGMSLFEYEGQENVEAEPRALLAINAIDGSIIDLDKGY